MKTFIMKSIFHQSFLTLILGLILITASAQQKDTVLVIASYQPTISDAFKINLKPEITDTSFEKPALKYSLLNRQARTSFSVEPIKPARIGDPTIPKLYNFLVKAGFGNYTTPYGEFYYNTLQNKSYSFGAHLYHLSSTGKIKDYAYPGFSNNEAEVYGRKFYANHTFYGKIGYDRDVVHYYGYDPADFPLINLSKNDIKQRFSLVTAEARLNSNVNPDSLKLNHLVEIHYYNFLDKYSTSENNILLNADINKELRLIKITKSQVLGIAAKVDYYFNKDSSFSHNSGLISLNPYLRTKFKAFTFNIGLDLTVEAASTSYIHLYPIADVQFNIVRDILILYAGIKGGMYRNSFRMLTDENPFITGISPFKNSSERINLFAGIRSNISREISANAWASYASIKDLPLFVMDTNNHLGNKYTVIYDNSDVFHIRGEVAWQKAERISLRLGGDFWNYDMKHELKAWEKPYFDVFLDFRYNLASKIIITADIYTYSDRWAKRYDAINVVPAKVGGYFDGNLGLEYRYNKRLGAFLNFNNIAAAKYQQWYDFRNYGFNLLGGVSYSF